MRKYLIRPGLVKSETDGDLHYVGAGQLMHLYNVHPRHCQIALLPSTRPEEGQIELRPRSDGKYALPPTPVEHRRPT